ncbi:hypothetical protein [Budvicia aquatica]|uniref:hypothetical protein n=1 Tax=Budvicia aquatica TaxID=82979 RepID=UPI0034CF58A7
MRGSPALSAFRITKLLSLCEEAQLPVSDIYAEYVHFADLTAPLSSDETIKLERLLQYGPSLAGHQPEGRLLLITPRPGTISPWSSKATDIAHNCGLVQVERLERGIAYYIQSDTLSQAQWFTLSGLLHDRMMESVFTDFNQAEALFSHHQPAPLG